MNDADNLNAKGLSRQLGKAGTQIFGGIITGEEYNRRLTGAQALRQYDIMRRSDATIASLLKACKLPIIHADWYVDAASDDAIDVQAAEDIRFELFRNKISFTKLLRQAFTCLDFGFSVLEKTYGIHNNGGRKYWGIDDIGYRKQTTILKWETEDGGEGITQQLLTESNASIPKEKLLVFTHDQEGENYEGISILRYVFKDWDMKDKLGLVLAVALEKAGIPTPIIEAPSNASQQDIDRAIEDIQQLRSNERGYILKREGWGIDKLDMSGQTTEEILPAIQYYDRQIVRSALAQFLELGASTSSGSYSLSEDQSALFEKSLEALAKQVQEVLQRDLIDQLCALNYANLPNGTPKLMFGKFSQDDIQKKSDAVSKLVQAGALTTDFDVENQVRKLLGIAELPEADRDGYTPPVKAAPAQTQVAASIKSAQEARKKLIDILVRQ